MHRVTYMSLFKGRSAIYLQRGNNIRTKRKHSVSKTQQKKNTGTLSCAIDYVPVINIAQNAVKKQKICPPKLLGS